MNSLKNHDTAWTSKDEKYLREHFGKVSTEVLSDRFGRTVHAIRQRARDLGIRVRPFYLPAQDAFLLRNHTRMSTAALAAKKNWRTFDNIMRKRELQLPVHWGGIRLQPGTSSIRSSSESATLPEPGQKKNIDRGLSLLTQIQLRQ